MKKNANQMIEDRKTVLCDSCSKEYIIYLEIDNSSEMCKRDVQLHLNACPQTFLMLA